jgi:hypothetical protein
MAGLLDPDDLLKAKPFAERWDTFPQRTIPGDTGGTSPLRNPLLQPMPNQPPQNYQQFLPPPAVPGGKPMPVMPGTGTMPIDKDHNAIVAPQSSRLPADADPRATLLALFKAYGLTDAVPQSSPPMRLAGSVPSPADSKSKDQLWDEYHALLQRQISLPPERQYELQGKVKVAKRLWELK